MKRSLIGFLVVGFAALSSSVMANTVQDRPNVIMIIVDDLNDYQNVFGGHPQVKTPNIDKLAQSGIRFTNAHTNVPVCQPSRNSLFTGVYPHVSGDFNWTAKDKHKILKHNKTITELFRENGYYTLGTGKLMHKGDANRWHQWGRPIGHNYGPIYFDGEKRSALPTVPSPFNEIGAIDGSFGRLSEGGYSEGDRRNKGWINGWDETGFRYKNERYRNLLPDEHHARWTVIKLAELARQKDKQPFFMGIGFVRPHTPLYAPDRFFDMYPLDTIELAPWIENDNKDTYLRDNLPADSKGLRYYQMLLASYENDREKALKHFLQAYLACVTFMDEQLGKVMNALEQHPTLLDNTMVIFTADHGWQMGEKGYLFKNSLWEESTRVPLIVREPNNPHNGKSVAHPVSLIDIFPTLVDYAKLKGNHKKNDRAADLGGHSLRVFLDNPDSQQWEGPQGALTMIGNYGQVTGIEAVDKQSYSFRTKDWRYILYSAGQEELYDHREDPHEWHNVADKEEYHEQKTKLNKALLNLIEQTQR